MVSIEQLAEAAIKGDSLQLRSLAQDWLRGRERFDLIPKPDLTDQNLMAIAASLVEMFAERAGTAAPNWTKDAPAATHPLFLLREAGNMKRLRKLCEEESPVALRRRHIFATPNFLQFA
jgi:hypothetical protein